MNSRRIPPGGGESGGPTRSWKGQKPILARCSTCGGPIRCYGRDPLEAAAWVHQPAALLRFGIGEWVVHRPTLGRARRLDKAGKRGRRRPTPGNDAGGSAD